MILSQQLELHFGNDAVWKVRNRAEFASFLVPQIEQVDSIPEAVEASLSQPINFPSLDQAVVPGDRLVLAVDPAVPALPQVISSMVGWFVDRGITLNNIQVVIAGNTPGISAELTSLTGSRIGGELSVELHDPDDMDRIAYIAANEASDPIYMNRTLVDADVVLPVSCCRPSNALDFLGGYSLFPLLSDRKTLGRFYRLSNLGNSGARKELTAWADQAAWVAGFAAATQVIPVGNNRVGKILSGMHSSLEPACREAMDRAWDTNAAHSDVVIALLDGGPQQSWLGIARALYAADRCTNDGGTIVVCTQVKERIGKALGKLRENNLSSDAFQRKVDKVDSSDAIAAALIQRITSHKRIYLVSGLKNEAVESLGIGVVESPEQLDHLLDQFSSGAVLGSIQHRNVST